MRDIARFLATAPPIFYLIAALVLSALMIFLVGRCEDRWERQQLEHERQNREAERLANRAWRIPDHVPDEWVR